MTKGECEIGHDYTMLTTLSGGQSRLVGNLPEKIRRNGEREPEDRSRFSRGASNASARGCERERRKPIDDKSRLTDENG